MINTDTWMKHLFVATKTSIWNYFELCQISNSRYDSHVTCCCAALVLRTTINNTFDLLFSDKRVRTLTSTAVLLLVCDTSGNKNHDQYFSLPFHENDMRLFCTLAPLHCSVCMTIKTNEYIRNGVVWRILPRYLLKIGIWKSNRINFLSDKRQ